MVPVYILCRPGRSRVKLCWEKSRESTAWLVREVFHPSACCPFANPQSPSSSFHQRKIQKGKGQNCKNFCSRTQKNSSRTVYKKSLNNTLQYSFSSSLPVCVPVLAHQHRQPPSTSPKVLSLSLHSLTNGPSSSKLALVLSLMPAPFSLSERELVSTENRGRREQCVG